MSEPVLNARIGLEIHARLTTRSKIFCACPAGRAAGPNSLVCPVCLGLPGVLPALNAEAVSLGVRLALATGCRLNKVSAFDRKNYFYPDLPKGYQITQYFAPLAEDGEIEFETGGESRRVGIERIHLEEDAAKSVHRADEGLWLLDFNRAGVPLAEIVTRPDLESPAQAAAFMHALRDLLVALGVCDGSLERGSLRCDGNISLSSPKGEPGQKVELKNINSYRYLEKALQYEIERQAALLSAGGRVGPETRRYDPAKHETLRLRAKEARPDYRYFPEPDLEPLVLAEELIERERGRIPELPHRRERRYREELGLDAATAGLLVRRPGLFGFFESALETCAYPLPLANWVVNRLGPALGEDPAAAERVTPGRLSTLVEMVEGGRLTDGLGREVLSEMLATGGAPGEIVARIEKRPGARGEDLAAEVRRELEEHPEELAKLRAGKTGLIDFFTGRIMRKTGGRADAKELRRVIMEIVGE